MIKKVDDECNEIIETEVLNSISRALNSLEYNTRTLKEDIRKDMKEKKASQIKETINSFIDWHVNRPTNAKMKALSFGPGKELSQIDLKGETK